MSQRNTILKTYLTESNTEMRRKLINIGIETEKEKDSNRLYLTRNRDNILKFPNIRPIHKNNGIKTLYNTNIFNKIIKDININSDYFETDNDIPIITSKINDNQDKGPFSNSVKKCKDNYNTLNMNNYYLDEIEKSNLVLSSVKTPKFNILKYDNISNINNIYNKKDFLKINKASSNDKNNNRTIIINNLKNNSKSNSNLNEEEKNTIQNLLNKKSIVKNFHKLNNNKKKKISKSKEHKDEFKDFLKEILKQYKDKNINKVKKKIDINTLLNNKHIKTQNSINIINKNNFGFNHSKVKDKTIKCNNYMNKKKYNYLILRNELLDTKLSRKNVGGTEDIKNKKRNIFNKYRFKKNRKIMSEVEEELINLEDKIKERFDRFRKNIDDEPGNFE